MKTFSKKHQIDLKKFKNFFGHNWRHTLTLLLALIVTVSFTHNAIAGVEAVQAINGEVTVKTQATITPTPTAFASAVNATTKMVPVAKTTSGDQTALAVKPLTRTKDSAAEEAAAQSTAPSRSTRTTRLVATASRSTSSNRSPSSFPYGYCTYWAASQAGWIDFHGNANRWPGNAAAVGHSVGKNLAAPGAIIVTNESFVGHVAFVTGVKDNKVTFTEMNFKGRGVVSERTLDLSNPKIVTFIQK